jgi:hypothetical protein
MDPNALRTQADRYKYPGLMPLEVAVMKEWLRLHESEYDHFDFNVRTGQGTDPGPTYPQNLRDMGVAITQKRIDAVAWKGGDPTLIEVKNRATVNAVGQILAYKVLFKADNPLSPEPKLLLVASKYDPDVYPVLQSHGVDYAIVALDPRFIPPRPFPLK